MASDSNHISFSASLDRFAKLSTIAVCLALTAIVLRAFSYFDTNPFAAVLSLTATMAIIIVCLLCRPLEYILTDDSLIVRRVLKNVTIARKEITTVRSVGEKELKGLVRVFGVGGLFGYFGKYGGKKSGGIDMYATNRSNSIMIETSAQSLIITPDDAAAFLQ